MLDKQEDNLMLGNSNFGSTGANNDAPISTNGESLESLVLGAPTNPEIGVPAMGQQSPRNGKPDLGM